MTASVKNPFQTIHGKQIQLVVTASTDDFLDISICNLNFRADINKHSLQIIGWAVTFILYGILLHFNNIIVNAVFAILLLWTVYGILHVVEKGKGECNNFYTTFLTWIIDIWLQKRFSFYEISRYKYRPSISARQSTLSFQSITFTTS